jgi:hypothetical protein
MSRGAGTVEYCQKTSERVFRTINDIAANVVRNEGGFRDFEIVPFYLQEKTASITTFPGQSCSISRDFDETRIYVDESVSPPLFVQLSDSRATATRCS